MIEVIKARVLPGMSVTEMLEIDALNREIKIIEDLERAYGPVVVKCYYYPDKTRFYKLVDNTWIEADIYA